MHIYIIRHGETEANANGYMQGWSNDPLNENGRKLAIMTGQGMKGLRFDYCLSSPLRRAVETAEIILRESGNEIPIKLNKKIKEINFGDYELMPIASPEFTLFLSDPFSCPPFPNGETVQTVMERTQSFLKDLIKRDDNKNYLVATHGGALRAMLNWLYEDPGDYWHGHVPYNCCVNIITASNGEVKLIADDKIYYDRKYCIDRYAL